MKKINFFTFLFAIAGLCTILLINTTVTAGMGSSSKKELKVNEAVDDEGAAQHDTDEYPMDDVTADESGMEESPSYNDEDSAGDESSESWDDGIDNYQDDESNSSTE